MIKALTLCALALGLLTACGSNPHRDPVNVGADAAQDAQASAAHVRSYMSIDACPPGFHAKDVDIATGSDAFIGVRNGSAESSSAAQGARRQKCVRN